MADESHSHSHEQLAEQHGEAAELDLSQSVSLHDLQSSVQLPLRDLDAAVLADIQRAYPQLTDLNLESNGQNSRTEHQSMCEQRCSVITRSSLLLLLVRVVMQSCAFRPSLRCCRPTCPPFAPSM